MDNNLFNKIFDKILAFKTQSTEQVCECDYSDFKVSKYYPIKIGYVGCGDVSLGYKVLYTDKEITDLNKVTNVNFFFDKELKNKVINISGVVVPNSTSSPNQLTYLKEEGDTRDNVYTHHLTIINGQPNLEECGKGKFTITYDSLNGGKVRGILEQKVYPRNNGSSVFAIADEGYYFSHWSDGNTSIAREEKYVLSDLHFTANFKASEIPPNNFLTERVPIFFVYDSSGSASNLTPILESLEGKVIEELQKIGYKGDQIFRIYSGEYIYRDLIDVKNKCLVYEIDKAIIINFLNEASNSFDNCKIFSNDLENKKDDFKYLNFKILNYLIHDDYVLARTYNYWGFLHKNLPKSQQLNNSDLMSSFEDYIYENYGSNSNPTNWKDVYRANFPSTLDRFDSELTFTLSDIPTFQVFNYLGGDEYQITPEKILRDIIDELKK